MKWLTRLLHRESQTRCEEAKPYAPSLRLEGQFLKKDLFEELWKSSNRESIKRLSDDDYIDYYLWKDENEDEMFKKHRPNTIVIKGSNPNIIFHGGCLGCLSQRIYSIDRCRGCQYFKVEWDKPNLFIEGEEADKLSMKNVRDILGGNNKNTKL